MDVSAYAEQAGLQDIGPAVLEKAQQYLDALKFALATSEEIDIAWQYAVPELGEGGSCSLFGQLASEPYDLLKTLGGDALAARPLLRAVTQITAFTVSTVSQTGLVFIRHESLTRIVRW
jgi:hypothetical protein